ncbi:MAG: hypothetical protein E7L19_10800 [Acinetobacter baumannii]|jgi:hypothetical protein|uniref:hypothetical protein n=1 Tax=Acinetobacter TaxID=469 RepID=UPI0021BFCFBA|nr:MULTISPECIES: hypothetical protein [Acinetobacter]MCT9265937.1 hypothetical protein [Acinetobacter baumannii]MCU4490782.1 hypothetical protein [Acinetobacter ursingii]MCU4604858.1 hypothetical protein [Acinetobacter ursingii]MDU7367612.1 hypothetical protein [Acinetobacter baumannii]MDV4311592.1 hypothetical protein [Acinetobacter baumannii]
MFELIGFLIVAFFGFKILRFFLSSPESNYQRASKKYMENPTDANYKFMLAAKIRMENRNK